MHVLEDLLLLLYKELADLERYFSGAMLTTLTFQYICSKLQLLFNKEKDKIDL